MISVRYTLLLAVVLPALTLGCTAPRHALPVQQTAPLQGDASASHTLIYLIHGDGDYLFHESGVAKRADVEALREAQMVARSAPAAEVFIFHQGRRQRILGLFTRADGRMLHYRGGRLMHDIAYSRQGSGFSAEAALYHSHATTETAERTFLYYGHDIPEEAASRYHASYPRLEFGLQQFTEGLRAFGADHRPFDLLVLSSCNNGSPGTIAAVAPYSRYVLAAPGDLHLSYIDSHPLHRVGSGDEDSEERATRLAQWAYDRLADRTKTAVALTLYDTDRLEGVLGDVERSYAGIRQRLTEDGRPLLADYVDCRDDVLLDLEADLPGVRPWYRPPAFGRASGKTQHSGWGCPVQIGAR